MLCFGLSQEASQRANDIRKAGRIVLGAGHLVLRISTTIRKFADEKKQLLAWIKKQKFTAQTPQLDIDVACLEQAHLFKATVSWYEQMIQFQSTVLGLKEDEMVECDLGDGNTRKVCWPHLSLSPLTPH
jgi:hypothetical protein